MHKRVFNSQAATTVGLASGLLAILLAAGITRHGSVAAAVASFRGQGLFVDEPGKSFGTVGVGESARVTFDVRNVAARSIKIVGSHSNCTCTITDTSFPRTLAPGEVLRLPVSISPPSMTSDFSQRVWLYTDFPGQRTLVLAVSGKVGAAPVVRR